MKKNLLIASALVLISGSVFLNGCKKDDTTAPVITVTGTNPVTVALNGTYSDAGATATDDVDGNITVSTTGSANPNVAGTYTISYSATDKAGNATSATRTVYVKVQWSGYSCADSSTNNSTIGAFAYSGNIAFGSGANQCIISNFSGTTANCIATVNGTTVTIASQVVGSFTILGNGTINTAGNQIILDYTATLGSTTDSFHAIFTKQ